MIIPDEFYEVTPEDLHTLRESEQMAKKEAEADRAVLKTREMRERAELKKFEKFTKVLLILAAVLSV